MEFKKWMNEEQSQDAMFMQTQKSGLGPKPSTNAGLPKPSDGWFRGKAQPALFMKRKMKKESVFHEELGLDPYEKTAREMVYLLDSRSGGRGEGKDRTYAEQETMKLLQKFFPDEQVDWERLSEMAKNAMSRLYVNYSQDYIRTQDGKLDSLLAYLPKYFHPEA